MDKELKNYMDSLISILYETNLTATEIAKRSGLSTSQISRILSGKCLPRFSSLCKIFSSLNIDIRLFFKNPNWSYSELLNDKISLMTDDEIKKLSESQLKGRLLDVIDRARQLRADIFGFGQKLYENNPEKWNEISGNYDSEFANIQVNLSVEIEIANTSIIYKQAD